MKTPKCLLSTVHHNRIVSDSEQNVKGIVAKSRIIGGNAGKMGEKLPQKEVRPLVGCGLSGQIKENTKGLCSGLPGRSLPR